MTMRQYLAVVWRAIGRARAWACYGLAWCLLGAVGGALTPIILLIDPSGLDRLGVWILAVRKWIDARFLPPLRGGDGSL